MKQFLIKTILPLVAPLALIACSEDTILDSEGIVTGGDSDKICFVVTDNNASRDGSAESRRVDGAYFYTADKSDSIYVSLTVEEEDKAASRATPIYSIGNMPIRVTCRKRNENGKSYYFSNLKFTRRKEDGVWVWASDPPYWWLNNDRCYFRFYGYAPADITGATYIDDEETWMPKLDYRVPDVLQQSDILYHNDGLGDNGEIIATYDKKVVLTMKHALSNLTFSTGKGMATGTIDKLTVKNVLGHGTLNLTDGTWTLDPSSVTDFSIDVNKTSSDNLALTTATDGTHFMLIPGSITEATTVDIVFTKDNAPEGEEKTKTYSGALTGTWEAGMSYRYVVTIPPDISTISDDTKPVDAHYVMCPVKVDAANMQQGQEWEMTASASDGANVTLLPEAELNDFQRQGIWIDRILVQANGSTTFEDQGSARGEAVLTGTGSGDVCLFLPENVSDTDRTVTLTMTIKGSGTVISRGTISQSHPAWTGQSFGWEQYEDGQAQWGFLWDRIVKYEKANIGLNLMVYGPLLTDFVNQYDPDNYYTTISQQSVIFGGKAQIAIDYTLLNDLSELNLTTDDGEANTRNLYYYSGGAATGFLEKAIRDLAPGPDYLMYQGCGVFNELLEAGGDISTANALAYTLKKNRYDLLRIEKKYSNITVVSEIPVINSSDIVWYLPAKDQFNRPATGGDPWSGTYWSSTPAGDTNAYAASGTGATPAYRMNKYKVRACRNRP